MIAYLEGTVIGIADSALIVLVGGAVGLQVAVPAALRAELRTGDTIALHTQMIVRQDMLALYGFRTEQERLFFNLLLGADGVGPRVALAVLSTLSVDAIRRAVSAEQSEVFSRVPGVGKRTAQKLLLHLQGKVSFDGVLERAGGLDESDEAVLAALTALGYSVIEAQAAVQNIPRDSSPDVEERLRLALGYFGG